MEFATLVIEQPDDGAPVSRWHLEYQGKRVGIPMQHDVQLALGIRTVTGESGAGLTVATVHIPVVVRHAAATQDGAS